MATRAHTQQVSVFAPTSLFRCCFRGGSLSPLSRPGAPPSRSSKNGKGPEYREANVAEDSDDPAASLRPQNVDDSVSQETFFDAAEQGDRDEVRRHLAAAASKKFDAQCVDPEDGYTAILLAAENGHVTIVEDLIKAGAKLNAKDSFGRTACYAAAVAGHADVVALLSRAGADADALDDDGRSPLWACCALRHLDVAQVLLDVARVAVDKRDHSGNSPLQHAVDSGHADVIDFLRKRGAKDARNGRLNTTTTTTNPTSSTSPAEIQRAP